MRFIDLPVLCVLVCCLSDLWSADDAIFAAFGGLAISSIPFSAQPFSSHVLARFASLTAIGETSAGSGSSSPLLSDVEY